MARPPEQPSIGAQIGAAYEAQITAMARLSLRTARSLIRAHPLTTPEAVAGLVRGAHQEIDRLSQIQLQRHKEQPGCTLGCTHCCHQEVTVSTVELVAIAVSLQPEDRATIATRAQDVVARTAAGGGHHARYRDAIPCPFLEDGACGIHHIRPQGCRTHYSLSQAACRSEWAARNHPGQSEGGSVPMPGGPKAIGMAYMLGLDAAVQERGLEVEVVELSQALPLIMQPGATEKWISGQRVFTAATSALRPGHPYRHYLASLASGAA